MSRSLTKEEEGVKVKEEEELALAFALSESLVNEELEQHRNFDLTIDNEMCDQSLAFFTDCPLSDNGGRGWESSMEEDVVFAQKLHEEENVEKCNELRKQIEIDNKLAQELQDELQENEKEMFHKNTCNSSNTNISRTKPKELLNNSHYKINTNKSICSVCDQLLVGKYKIVENLLHLHQHCFCCAGCYQPIEKEYIKKGELEDGNIEFYHSHCNVQLFAPDCDLCGDKIYGNYKTHGFFRDKQKYCASHDIHNEHRSCCSCDLIEPIAKGQMGQFHPLPDGRVICPDCVSFIILESNEAKDIYLQVVDFMEHTLNLAIPPYMREVPVLAVDLPSLNDQSSLNRHFCGAHPPVQLPNNDSFVNATGFSSSVTRGLTISTTSSVRHFSPGSLSWNSLTNSLQNTVAPTLIALKYHTSVTAVLVLCGLTRTLTASILAHEAMHVWLRLNSNVHESSVNQMAPIVEEGVCQLMSSIYLDHINSISRTPASHVTSASHADWNDRLLPYYMYQIETDPGPVYGDGFRHAAEAHAAIGLLPLLEYVVSTGQFPVL